MPTPTGDFEVTVAVAGGVMTTTVTDGDVTETIEVNIVWSDTKNYWKAGPYIQDGNPESYPVDFKRLERTSA